MHIARYCVKSVMIKGIINFIISQHCGFLMSKKQIKSDISDDQSQKSDKSQNEEEIVQNEETNVPKIDRNLSYKTDCHSIIINLAFTKYPVVKLVAQKLKMVIIDEPNEPNWDVCWTDFMIMPRNFIRMHFHQTINYIPGISAIARKNFLGKNLNQMKINFPLQYNFHPQTWMLPEDFPLLRKYLQQNKNETLIVKPEADCQGRGIYLINKMQDLRRKGKHCIIQKYIESPLLIDGYKFDLRIYVLIGSVDPLRIYLYNDGLARFATEKYEAPNKDNYHLNFQHLTNYAINKFNPKFKASNSGGDGQSGFKRSLTSVMKTLSQRGIDTASLWQKIKDISVKTIFTCYHQIKHNYVSSQPEEYHNRMAFHILGLDIMINENAQPILLEVNHTPSFATQTPLDHKIKFGLIKNTLQVMQCHNLKLKEILLAKSKISSSNRIEQGKIQQYNDQIRMRQVQKNMQERIQNEKPYLNNYEIIFPHQNEQINKKYTSIIEETKKLLYSHIKVKFFSEKEVDKDKQVRQVRQVKRNKDRQRPKEKEKEKQKESIQFQRQSSHYLYKSQLEPKQFQFLQQRFTLGKKYGSVHLGLPKSTKYFSTITRTNDLDDVYVINQALISILNKDTKAQNYFRKHPLNTVAYKNVKAFTIKTKYSNSDRNMISNDKSQKKMMKRSQEIAFSNNKINNRQGCFLKPTTYDVPALKNQQIFIENKSFYRTRAIKIRSVYKI